MMTSLPQRFACNAGFDKEGAQEALLKDGSIILTELEPSPSWSEISALVPTLVWDSNQLLLNSHRADAVHIEHEALELQGEALPPHSDGYIWGDCFPDLVILVCETPADNQEGANYLIDGYAVFNRLSERTKDFLEKEQIDHTERGENSYAQGAESVVPLIRYLDPKGWRAAAPNMTSNLCWRRMISKDGTKKRTEAKEAKAEEPYISIWAPPLETEVAKADAIKEALLEVDQAIAAEEGSAPRFALKKGEALIVDNFRMLHARGAFHGSENTRRMWRVWSWTDASFGLPPEVQATGENVPSNILQAEKAIQAQA